MSKENFGKSSNTLILHYYNIIHTYVNVIMKYEYDQMSSIQGIDSFIINSTYISWYIEIIKIIVFILGTYE